MRDNVFVEFYLAQLFAGAFVPRVNGEVRKAHEYSVPLRRVCCYYMRDRAPGYELPGLCGLPDAVVINKGQQGFRFTS